MDGLDEMLSNIAEQSSVEDTQTQTQPEITNTQTSEAPLDSTSQGQETEQNQEVTATQDDDAGAKSETDSEFEEWDSTSSDVIPETKELDEDWKELGKALNIPFERKDHVVAEIKRLADEKQIMEKELNTLKSTDPYASDDFKKANEIAKLGGDWKEYLDIASTDYGQYTDDDLVRADIAKYFPQTPEGEEEMESYLQNMSSFDKRVQGSKIREALKQDQEFQKIQKEKEVIERKREADTMLRKTLDGTNEIAGLKLKPNHRKEVYDDISSGQLMNKLFYDDRGQLDYNKMVKNAFVLKNFDKIVSYYQTKSKNEGKKDVINSINNVDLHSSSKIPSPNAGKSASALDNWMDNLSHMR